MEQNGRMDARDGEAGTIFVVTTTPAHIVSEAKSERQQKTPAFSNISPPQRVPRLFRSGQVTQRMATEQCPTRLVRRNFRDLVTSEDILETVVGVSDCRALVSLLLYSGTVKIAH